MCAQHRLSWIAKNARSALGLYGWRREIGVRAAAAQTVALVSVAFVVSVNHGAYSDVNLFLTVEASVLFVTVVLLIAREEPRNFIGVCFMPLHLCLCLGYRCSLWEASLS